MTVEITNGDGRSTVVIERVTPEIDAGLFPIKRVMGEEVSVEADIFANGRFLEADNETVLFYGKTPDDLSNIILVAVNLDPFHTQSGRLQVPIGELAIDPSEPCLVHDLLSDEKYIWQGEPNYVDLGPAVLPAAILRIRRRPKREMDFDYFM